MANTGSLGDVFKTFSEKQSNSIKEVVKVLTHLLTKLDAFATEVKSTNTAVRTSNIEIHTEHEGIREAMGFMNESFEAFKKDIDLLRLELAEVKTQNSQCQQEIQKLQKDC